MKMTGIVTIIKRNQMMGAFTTSSLFPPHWGALMSVVVDTEKRLKSAYVNVTRPATRTAGGVFFSRTLSKNETAWLTHCVRSRLSSSFQNRLQFRPACDRHDR